MAKITNLQNIPRLNSRLQMLLPQSQAPPMSQHEMIFKCSVIKIIQICCMLGCWSLYALLWVYWHVKINYYFAQWECRTREGLVKLNIFIGLRECGSTGFIEHYHWTTGAWELYRGIRKCQGILKLFGKNCQTWTFRNRSLEWLSSSPSRRCQKIIILIIIIIVSG